jgi:hypothetical protein
MLLLCPEHLIPVSLLHDEVISIGVNHAMGIDFSQLA